MRRTRPTTFLYAHSLDGLVAMKIKKATMDSEIRLAKEQLKLTHEATAEKITGWRLLKEVLSQT